MNYRILDTHTGLWLKRTYKMRVSAERTADRLDLEYGAVRYAVRFIPVLSQAFADAQAGIVS